jgi:hypothetical protein
LSFVRSYRSIPQGETGGYWGKVILPPPPARGGGGEMNALVDLSITRVRHGYNTPLSVYTHVHCTYNISWRCKNGEKTTFYLDCIWLGLFFIVIVFWAEGLYYF